MCLVCLSVCLYGLSPRSPETIMLLLVYECGFLCKKADNSDISRYLALDYKNRRGSNFQVT